MSLMTETVAPDPTPEQAALFARVRRLMLIAGLTTGLAVAAVLIAIGYRLFRSEGSVAVAEITAVVPKGAKIVSITAAGDRVVVTLDVGGTTEIRTFDAHTLKTTGRLRFVSEPQLSRLTVEYLSAFVIPGCAEGAGPESIYPNELR
jgi:hypothetical protein